MMINEYKHSMKMQIQIWLHMCFSPIVYGFWPSCATGMKMTWKCRLCALRAIFVRNSNVDLFWSVTMQYIWRVLPSQMRVFIYASIVAWPVLRKKSNELGFNLTQKVCSIFGHIHSNFYLFQEHFHEWSSCGCIFLCQVLLFLFW